MASPLLESLEALVTPQVLSRTARDLGESEANIARGFSSGFGATLAGLTSRAGDAGFMRQIFDLIGSKVNDGRILEDPSALFSGPITSPAMDLGSKFLTSVFGGRTSGVRWKAALVWKLVWQSRQATPRLGSATLRSSVWLNSSCGNGVRRSRRPSICTGVTIPLMIS